MSDFDLFVFNSMIIGLIAIFFLILIVYKRIDFRNYVPGLICFVIFFFIEVFEVEIYEEFFDLLENASFLLGTSLLLTAVLFEYYKSKPKRNNMDN